MAYRYWLIVALSVCYGMLIYRWWAARRTGANDGSRWSRPRFPILTLLLIVPLIFLEARWQIREHEASTAISDASQGCILRCQRWTEANFFPYARSGYVEYDNGVPAKESILTWETCQDLFRWLESDKTDPSVEQATAVHVLVHEAQHMAGITSEAQAECAAIGADPEIAQRLGATSEQAALLTDRYVTNIYPRLRDEYRGPCPAADAYTDSADTTTPQNPPETP